MFFIVRAQIQIAREMKMENGWKAWASGVLRRRRRGLAMLVESRVRHLLFVIESRRKVNTHYIFSCHFLTLRCLRNTVYKCKVCGTTTTFPRFNSPRSLFKSRRGRCGEFANLFGVYCRSLGFDTRYVLDFTDHVWTEVWSVRQQRWLHADSCEGLIDKPNMYEQGWGKKLNYAIGATYDSVADVTKRYTRKFYTNDFQGRRREFAPDENTSDRAFSEIGAALRQMNNIGKGRLEELEKRGKAEETFFGMVQSSGVWDVDYREGRSE